MLTIPDGVQLIYASLALGFIFGFVVSWIRYAGKQ